MTKSKIKGAGDLVKTVTEAIGIKPCEGCKDRTAWMNLHFPFTKPRLLTDNEKDLVLSGIDAELLEVYNNAFNQELEAEQFVGGVKKSVINKLHKLAEYNIK